MTILSDIQELLVKHGVDPSKVRPTANLMDDLGLDSLDMVELVMALEEVVGGEISDEDAEKLTTVQEVIDFVQARKT